MRRPLAVFALLATLAAPALADYDAEMERREAAQREAEQKEQQRRQAEMEAKRNATELHAMRQFLGAEAEGRSDAEVRQLYDARTEAYKRQAEAAAAAAPTAAELEKRERDTRAERDDAVRQMTGKSLEELENMTDEEAEALQRELEKKYGAE
jgi:hypothetical protein